MNALILTYIKKVQELLEKGDDIVINKNSFEVRDRLDDDDFDLDMIREMYDN